MHLKISRVLLTAGSLFLTASLIAPLAQAQPPHSRGQAAERSESHGSSRNDYRQHNDRLNIDEAVIRSIFREQRDYLQPADRLPPGIQRNLERGKPLPPGIAKRFDDRVYRQLPNYEGYEWRQVGRDAVLIAVTTGVIEAIFDNILD